MTKRPLLRPPIPSPRSGASQPKVIYVSARTSFIPVIKRVEKLLALAEKRNVQSATTLVQKDRMSRERYGKRKANAAGDDDLLDIARTAAKRRRADDGGVVDEVVIKGTGKAVQKVLDFGLWFQQREERFAVSLRTGSVGAIDDIEVPEDDADGTRMDDEDAQMAREATESALDVAMEDGQDVEIADALGKAAQSMKVDKTCLKKGSYIEADAIPEARLHYTSSLEVSVRLR